MRLKDKIAIVTGGSGGLGEGIALCLAREGADVVVSDINMDLAEKVAEKVREAGRDALAVQTDVRSLEQVEEMVRKAVNEMGTVDILACSHGVSGMTHREHDPDEPITLEGITELQCGTYLLMDDVFTQAGVPFEQAMKVLATVLTVRGTRVVCDAGAKALHTRGLPRAIDLPDLTPVAIHAEHCLWDAASEPAPVRVGDKIALSVYYADGTFNLHDRYVAHRGDDVVEDLVLEGRDCSR